MNSHLVAVKVRIKGGTYQRMQLDGLAFNQNGLKGLNTQSVQGRSTVQHNRMFFDNFLQHIPYLRLQLFHHFLCIFNIMRRSVGHQLLHNERLEQLNGHLFRQTALIDFQLRSHDDNRTSGVVHTFSQKVLAETSGFSLQHIGQGLQRTVARTRHRTAAASVVNQSVHRLLQHTFLIAHDDIRRSQLQQSLQTVIPVDNSPVQIVQIRRGKPAAVQLHHRTQIRRNDRNGIHNHPLRTVAGLPECFHNFQSFNNSGALLARRFLQALLQLG